MGDWLDPPLPKYREISKDNNLGYTDIKNEGGVGLDWGFKLK